MQKSIIAPAGVLVSEPVLITETSRAQDVRPDEVVSSPLSATKVASKIQYILLGAGGIGFLHIARPLVLPIVLACVGAMTLKPLIRWLSCCRLRPAFGAAVVLSLFGLAVTIAVMTLAPPAMAWVNDTPAHMAQLRQRVLKMLPRAAPFTLAAAALNNLGATEKEQNRPPMVEVKDTHGSKEFMNWTGSFLAGVGEAVVLLYLLLASGDLFLQKLVHVMPTLGDKKRAVEISHEIQQN